MSEPTLLVVDDAREIREFVADVVLRPSGYRVLEAADGATALELVAQEHPQLVISDIKMPGITGLDMARAIQHEWPGLPVILITAEGSEEIAQQALRAGAVDYFIKPFDPDELLQSVQRARARAAAPRPAAAPAHGSDLETLLALSREAASPLDADRVLPRVVEAAVHLTGAEAGALWVAEAGGDLAARAAYGAAGGPERLAAADTLAGQVLRSGEALQLAGGGHRLASGAEAQAVLYAPLRGREQVLGVLGVENRQAARAFDERALRLVRLLADYAAITLESAQLYSTVETERTRLYTILNEIEDGVIVLDADSRLALVNHPARRTLGVERVDVAGQLVADVINHPDLLALATGDRRVSEVALADGRTFSVRVTPLAAIGRVLIMHDVTHLKELDRVKSEFVTTVSHDLRSPLTSMLGYLSLLERVGPLNERQQEFAQQLRTNVQAMTSLLSELLDLGRIEAGLDAQKEILPISGLVHRLVEEKRPEARERGQVLHLRVAAGLPPVPMNVVRLRQALLSLLDNAVRYTPEKGQISVDVYTEGEFVVITVTDSGVGIPPADQPYIFDKFFRAANVRGQYPGAGLGLSVAKSIVEQHGGRIWVDSSPGTGSTFSLMLPTARARSA
ncbi:MAG: response regulator [Anaerolineales bacterium]|nr:response regulator [Anaerolineales bacterium]